MAAPPLTEPAALPQKCNGLAENIPGKNKAKPAPASCPTAAICGSGSRTYPLLKQLARGAGVRLLQACTQCRTEDKIFLLLLYFTMKNSFSSVPRCAPACKSSPPAPLARALHAASAVEACCWHSGRQPLQGSSLALALPFPSPACFRPGRCTSAGAPQVLSRVAQPPSGARRALDRF